MPGQVVVRASRPHLRVHLVFPLRLRLEARQQFPRRFQRLRLRRPARGPSVRYLLRGQVERLDRRHRRVAGRLRVLAGGLLAAVVAALVKGVAAQAGAGAYALMMLLAWGAGVLLVAYAYALKKGVLNWKS